MPAQEVSFDPEMETKFQAYRREPQTDEARCEIVLGDPTYGRRVRMPKWNIQVTMLEEPKVAVRYAHSWGIPTSKEAHRQRAERFRTDSLEYRKTREELVGHAYAAYGKHGPLISGVVRDHFPADVKHRLRFLDTATYLTDAAARLHEKLSKSRSPSFR